MASRRKERVAALLREAIGTLLLQDTKDPRLASVIITGVDLSADLRHARVFYRVLAACPDSERAGQALERARHYIQASVGRTLRLRYTPELRFFFDQGPDRLERVDRLLASASGDTVDE